EEEAERSGATAKRLPDGQYSAEQDDPHAQERWFIVQACVEQQVVGRRQFQGAPRLEPMVIQTYRDAPEEGETPALVATAPFATPGQDERESYERDTGRDPQH